MEVIIGYIIAITAIVIIGKVLLFPIKKILKFVLNGVIGAVMLLVLNAIGSSIGITVGVNIVSALIAGFFGIPGIIFLVIVNMI
ncbi:MAG: pro-sigmaK processing inhibitor BofA family protein [Andreesenia angusta]|nr:pro-sigmaK processing inhibitor BofA family protein [Andreesenia angusta]